LYQNQGLGTDYVSDGKGRLMKIITACQRFVSGKYFIVHPLLLSIFPMLFLYVQNINETAGNQVLLPMLFSLAGSLVLWLILSLIIKSVVKAGIAVSLFLVFFFSYGRLYELLEKWGFFVPSHAHLLPVMLFICGYCIYFISIARRDFKNTTRILNFIAIVLVLINLGNLVFYQIGKPTLSSGNTVQSLNRPTQETSSVTTAGKPDIYYIILDEYAHPDTMKEYYSYDNSDFINFLEEKGFYWASESRTSEEQTQRSISSSLNMEFLHQTDTNEVVFSKLDSNQVASFIKSRGYKFIYFQSWFGLGKNNLNSDLIYNYYKSAKGSNISGEFQHILWNTTMLVPFYDALIAKQFDEYHRNGLVDTLEQLKKMPEEQGHKFVFAHILCPHEPFVFGKNGEIISILNWSNYKEKRYYRDQYIYISEQIQIVVESLLQKSATPPIIIIQSDHGIRPAHPGIEIGKTEWQKILNIYYLPEGGNNLLNKSISPVNSFRIIFNYYFGAEIDLLENK
jgi:hypothetical protein